MNCLIHICILGLICILRTKVLFLFFYFLFKFIFPFLYLIHLIFIFLFAKKNAWVDSLKDNNNLIQILHSSIFNASSFQYPQDDNSQKLEAYSQNILQ